jgi:hypothetical protein
MMLYKLFALPRSRTPDARVVKEASCSRALVRAASQPARVEAAAAERGRTWRAVLA